MSIQWWLSNRTKGVFIVVIILLTQSSCDGIFDVEFDNSALKLEGDWSQYCVLLGIMPFREDFPTNNSEYAEVNKEWCVTYRYPVSKLV